MSEQRYYESRLYRIWYNMRNRCNNPNNPNFPYYGGRGIKVCEEWDQNYNSFEQWAISNGYQDDLTVDRKDVNGNYEPNNCKWSTRKEQTNNRRVTRRITANGETHTVPEWAEITGLKPATINARINKLHWDEERAVTTLGNANANYIEYNGETHSLREWSKILDISYDMLKGRIDNYGWSFEKAINTEYGGRRSTKIEHDGQIYTVTELERMYGLSKGTISRRLKDGWSLDKALNTPMHYRRRYYNYNGERLTMSELANKYGINYATLRDRLEHNWDLEKAVNTPVRVR